MTTLKPGTLRLIPRWNENNYGPVVGLVTFPLPDGAREGDMIEVILGPDGKATWSVKAHDALGKEGDSPWPNAFTLIASLIAGMSRTSALPKRKRQSYGRNKSSACAPCACPR